MREGCVIVFQERLALIAVVTLGVYVILTEDFRREEKRRESFWKYM